jgi:ABC transporter with metal-binding/Fe-S-binding domain ATP-binding protein
VRVGILFSGGKDSCLAFYKARRYHDVVCLISLISKNKESYMFHVPNISITSLQAQAIGLPLIHKITEGKKEEELLDLEAAILIAKKKFEIEGVVMGSIKSIYQASRIQKVCDKLSLWCFNPLWLRDQVEVLREGLSAGIKTIISGVFAYPLDINFLGKTINDDMVAKLEIYARKYGLNPAGEGGEIETTVINAPFFKKEIEILEHDIVYKNYSGWFVIKRARLIKK